MVPIIPCNVPLAGIVGVLMRMEGKSKALREEVGQTVTYQVMARITDIGVHVLFVISITCGKYVTQTF